MAEVTTGDHKHCFCTQDTAGQVMCCMCGTVLGSTIIDIEALLIEHQVQHLKRTESGVQE